jgi:hypothetical protein
LIPISSSLSNLGNDFNDGILLPSPPLTENSICPTLPGPYPVAGAL